MSVSKRPLRVGYVLRKFPVLSETFILNEILALEAQGVEVHIFSMAHSSIPRFHEDLPKLKANILYMPEFYEPKMLMKYCRRAARRYGRKYRKSLRYTLARMRPSLWWRFLQSGYVAEKAGQLRLDHLHAHFANRAATVTFLASMISGIPYSFTAHAYDIFSMKVRKNVLRRKIEKAKFVVTVSDFNKNYLQQLTQNSVSKVSLIYNGIDLARFQTNGACPDSPFVILSVARLVEKKGHRILVEACRHLKERGLSFQCNIVGTGALRADLERLIQTYGLRKSVRLLGPHTQLEVLDRYHSSHVFVLPCLVDSAGNRDGLPVAIVEALACGLPVISTDTTGVPEVVHHNVNGIIVPHHDPVALAEALQTLILNPQKYEMLRANARNSVLRSFNIEHTSVVLKDLFEGREVSAG